MGWTHKHRKMRDALRKRYTDETGKADYAAPAFKEWLKAQGEIE